MDDLLVEGDARREEGIPKKKEKKRGWMDTSACTDRNSSPLLAREIEEEERERKGRGWEEQRQSERERTNEKREREKPQESSKKKNRNAKKRTYYQLLFPLPRPRKTHESSISAREERSTE